MGGFGGPSDEELAEARTASLPRGRFGQEEKDLRRDDPSAPTVTPEGFLPSGENLLAAGLTVGSNIARKTPLGLPLEAASLLLGVGRFARGQARLAAARKSAVALGGKHVTPIGRETATQVPQARANRGGHPSAPGGSPRVPGDSLGAVASWAGPEAPPYEGGEDPVGTATARAPVNGGLGDEKAGTTTTDTSKRRSKRRSFALGGTSGLGGLARLEKNPLGRRA